MPRSSATRALLPIAIAAASFAAAWRWTPEVPREPPDRRDPRAPRAPETQGEEQGRSPGGGDYFAVRLTYPTGRFDSRWLVAAAEEHRALAAGVPAGARVAATRRPRRPPARRIRGRVAPSTYGSSDSRRGVLALLDPPRARVL